MRTILRRKGFANNIFFNKKKKPRLNIIIYSCDATYACCTRANVFRPETFPHPSSHHRLRFREPSGHVPLYSDDTIYYYYIKHRHLSFPPRFNVIVSRSAVSYPSDIRERDTLERRDYYYIILYYYYYTQYIAGCPSDDL